MADLDEFQLAKLAREMVMNIRNYQAVFDDFGIDENDYYEIEKNDFYKRVKEQFAVEWNSTLSTEERLRVGSLAYLEQLYPIITRRAMREETNLMASVETGKLLMKTAGIGEVRSDKNAAERFVITINLGGEEKTYDKSIEVNPQDTPPKPLKAPRKSKYKQVEAVKHGPSDVEATESDPE